MLLMQQDKFRSVKKQADMQDAHSEKKLEDYLSHLLTDDILAATQEARRKSTRVLQDQGISAIAILISNVIAEVIEHPEMLMDNAPNAASVH